MLFLVQTEISIVTTSLVAITHDLGGFETASWIMSSYLLGYVGVVVIITKLSDIFGRKPAYMLSIFIFTVFSGGCAAAQTMPQLIIMRAFQGVGGGGSYALSTVLIIEIVPPRKYGKLVAYTGIAIVLAMVLGPIIGGGISSRTTWRWIFLFNVPVGAVGLALAFIGIPDGFPNQNRPNSAGPSEKPFARLDLLGCVLLLLATMSFTSAFQEAGSRFSWDSAYVISLLVVSVVIWAALLTWERATTLANKVREPVLPWRFLTSRAMVGILLEILLLGGPLTVTTLQLPQRFQLVNGLSSIKASAILVPFGAAVPFGTIATANLSKAKVPFLFIIVAGSLLQVIGFALLGTLEASAHVPRGVYGYQVLAGLGCGLCFQAGFLAIPFTAEKRDQAVGLGTATQSRAMGSAIMVAVTTSVFNGLSQASSLVAAGMTAEVEQLARQILSRGYNRQMYVLCACGAAQVPAAFLMWRKKQIKAM
ncbi:Multidrug resistance protein 3 [Escovopsis weberi]|uniref:Multidrug resistance protein 3 n=1 Tax=Escovopsis weberi TaxID=150374 RepID=A0A0N0RU27_ESCWE|nr:Multidrug resistance protein 3 [Escovopsis weberi]